MRTRGIGSGLDHVARPPAELLRVVHLVLVQQLVVGVDDASAALSRDKEVAHGFDEPGDALGLRLTLPRRKVVW